MTQRDYFASFLAGSNMQNLRLVIRSFSPVDFSHRHETHLLFLESKNQNQLTWPALFKCEFFCVVQFAEHKLKSVFSASSLSHLSWVYVYLSHRANSCPGRECQPLFELQPGSLRPLRLLIYEHMGLFQSAFLFSHLALDSASCWPLFFLI